MLDAPASVAKLALLAMNDIPTGSFIGRSLARREDRRLLNDYVPKPYSLRQLLAKTRQYIPQWIASICCRAVRLVMAQSGHPTIAQGGNGRITATLSSRLLSAAF
jgi:hypothetical protein